MQQESLELLYNILIALVLLAARHMLALCLHLEHHIFPIGCSSAGTSGRTLHLSRGDTRSDLTPTKQHCEVTYLAMMLRRGLAASSKLSRTPLTKSSIRRWYATEPTPSSPSPAPQLSRIARLESRLPRFLHRYTTPLRTAPVSHITAFFILHEITAILPLFGLAALFHYTNWLPPGLSEWKWVSEGISKFGKYARRKGWISDAEEGHAGRKAGIGRWWGTGEAGTRWVVEFATAYACTKVLLPLRLVVSVWGTPVFARWTVVPVSRSVRRVVSRWLPSRSGGGVVKTKG